MLERAPKGRSDSLPAQAGIPLKYKCHSGTKRPRILRGSEVIESRSILYLQLSTRSYRARFASQGEQAGRFAPHR